MQLIDDILNYEKHEDFKQVDLKNLSLENYESILKSRISTLSESNYQVGKCQLLIGFMSAFIEQHPDKNKEIENIHYDLLLSWMTSYQKDSLSSILVGQELVEFLTLKISLEKLNEYNQATQNSVLKQLLLRYENSALYQILVDHGLIITDVEALNPYYYTLLNGTSSNVTVQLLHSHYEILPENIWSYVFNGIVDGKVKPERDYLLKLKNKQFIVDSKQKLSVWNRIIRSKKYNLINYLSDDMYKPYTVENKTLVDELLQNNDLLFLTKVREKILKLVDNETELYKLWNATLLDESGKKELVGAYYNMFMNILKDMSDERAKTAVDKQNELIKLREKNVLYRLLKEITDYMYSQKETVNDKIDKDYYASLDNLIKIYKTRRDFPTELRAKILDYLKSLALFHETAPKQTETTISCYEIDSNFIFNSCFDEENFAEEKHFKDYINQLNEEYKTIVFEQINNIQYSVKLDSVCATTEPAKIEEPKYEFVGPEEEKLKLFTDEAANKFRKETGTEREVVQGYMKKLNTQQKNYQYKTLAKASVLLEQLDNLYETFPHFENVINHIRNLMVLQDKGDKSFYVPPLLLGGGPGVGKTFFCHTISKLVNTHFELLNMESVTANFILTGSSAQWGGAEPGKIFKNLFSEDYKTINPIILLDELEKAGGDSRYGVMNSLLPLLERYTAKKFKDECIPLEIDASYIVWFATANDLDKLTAPIKSRFDIFSVPNPTPVQRKSLIKGIYKTVRENNTWGSYFDEVLPEDSLDVLANLMAPGAARDLRKSITMACSKAIIEESKIILPSHIERFEIGEIMPWDIIAG